MSGFLERFATNSFLGNKRGKNIVKDIITIGLKYDDMVINNSHALGVSQAEFGDAAFGDEKFLKSLALSDIGTKKNIAYFNKEYKSKRDYLRKFALNGEIEWILDTIADESIVYDENNFFININNVFFESDLNKKVQDSVADNFKKIYNYFNFNDDTTAWDYFRQFLIDGFLAFEIIFDDSSKKIIGFKELDPASLRPDIEIDAAGNSAKVWHQYEEDPKKYSKLKDSQVIYISYAKSTELSRISYVERLVRSFNLLRVLENSRIIWNLMNSTYRLKMVVPIGSKSPQRAKESLRELMTLYKEDIDLDFDSGELFTNGRPGMQFYKNYLIPSKNGEQTELETVGGDGPDLSDTDALLYFSDKLKKDSKIPSARFDNSSGGGSFSIGADGIDRDEIRFSKFITRLRSKFQEIIFKPLYIQMILDYPELLGDGLFKSQIGFKFNMDNQYEEIKDQEITQRRLDHVESLRNLTESDGTTPYFDIRYLIETKLFLSKEELEKNEKYKQESKKRLEGSSDTSLDGEETDNSDIEGETEQGTEGEDDPNDDESSAGTNNFGF